MPKVVKEMLKEMNEKPEPGFMSKEYIANILDGMKNIGDEETYAGVKITKGFANKYLLNDSILGYTKQQAINTLYNEAVHATKSKPLKSEAAIMNEILSELS